MISNSKKKIKKKNFVRQHQKIRFQIQIENENKNCEWADYWNITKINRLQWLLPLFINSSKTEDAFSDKNDWKHSKKINFRFIHWKADVLISKIFFDFLNFDLHFSEFFFTLGLWLKYFFWFFWFFLSLGPQFSEFFFFLDFLSSSQPFFGLKYFRSRSFFWNFQILKYFVFFWDLSCFVSAEIFYFFSSHSSFMPRKRGRHFLKKTIVMKSSLKA